MIQRFTRLPAIQSHVGLHKNVEIIIALVIATAIGLWIGCRGRKPEELVSKESLLTAKPMAPDSPTVGQTALCSLLAGLIYSKSKSSQPKTD